MMSPCKREGWYTKLETKGDIRGSGYMQIVTSPPKENYVQIFIFRLILFSAQQQLSFVYHFGGGLVSGIGLSTCVQAR